MGSNEGLEIQRLKNKWTEGEDQVLIRDWQFGSRKLVELLPGRSRAAIRYRISRLRGEGLIPRPSKAIHQPGAWSEGDETFLVENYDKGLKLLVQELEQRGRPRSYYAVKGKIRELRQKGKIQGKRCYRRHAGKVLKKNPAKNILQDVERDLQVCLGALPVNSWWQLWAEWGERAREWLAVKGTLVKTPLGKCHQGQFQGWTLFRLLSQKGVYALPENETVRDLLAEIQLDRHLELELQRRAIKGKYTRFHEYFVAKTDMVFPTYLQKRFDYVSAHLVHLDDRQDREGEVEDMVYFGQKLEEHALWVVEIKPVVERASLRRVVRKGLSQTANGVQRLIKQGFDLTYYRAILTPFRYVPRKFYPNTFFWTFRDVGVTLDFLSLF